MRSYRYKSLGADQRITLAGLKLHNSKLPEGADWIEDSDGLALRVRSGIARSHTAIKFRLPLTEPVEALHLRLDMSGQRLIRGKDIWEEGRVLIQWLPPDASKEAVIDGVSAVSDNEEKHDVSVVVRPPQNTGFPVMLIENLGDGGDLLISGLEISLVKQRSGWLLVDGAMITLWILWLVGVMAGRKKMTLIRRSSAAGVWVVLGVLFAFPGPWKTLHPMFVPFALEAKTDGSYEEPSKELDTSRLLVSYDAADKMDAQEGLIIHIRHQLKKLRPLLHIGFVFFATIGFLWLVGVTRAIWLSAGLVVAIEACQFGFGFGFDWQDVSDLICGVIGIFFACQIYAKLSERMKERLGVFAPPSQVPTPAIKHGTQD